MANLPGLTILLVAFGLVFVGYGVSRFFGPRYALACVLPIVLAVPIGAYVVLVLANRHAVIVITPIRELLDAIVLLAVTLLWLAAIGLGWYHGRKRRTWLISQRDVLIVFGSFTSAVVLAFAAYLGKKTIDRIHWRDARRQEGLLRWNEAEIQLRHCAETLSSNLGASDARDSLRRGDRRLLGIYGVYQEASSFDVPGVVLVPAPDGVYSAPDYVSAHIGSDDRLWRIEVRVTPKGQLWTDPWGYVAESMGRQPDSAVACNLATRAYVTRYNQMVLNAGVAKKLIELPHH